MPTFIYSAIDIELNRTVEGTIEAENIRDAKANIRAMNQLPTTITEHREAFDFDQIVTRIPALSFFTNPSLKDVTIFTQQTYTLLNAGIPLIEALFLLEQQTSNKTFQSVLKKVRTDVISGDAYSTAIGRYPAIFNKLYVNMITAGEISGTLEQICDRLGSLLEKEMSLRGKVQGAMTLPAITATIISLVTAGLLIFVVPQFAQIFAGAGNSLPMPTQALLAISDFLKNFWWGIGIGLGGFAFWFNLFRVSAIGKPLVDQWMLRIPVLGLLLNRAYASTFVRTLSTLSASGVSVTEGLSTASSTISNYVILTALEKVRDSVLTGGGIAKPLELSGAFPSMVVKMIAVGEETGNLDRMLVKSADYLDQEVDAALNKLIEMIQPVMTVVLGAILLFIMLGLYLPIFDMHKNVTG